MIAYGASDLTVYEQKTQFLEEKTAILRKTFLQLVQYLHHVLVQS